MEQPPNLKNPSNGKAIASLVLGVIAVICAFLGWGAFIGVILGLIGFILGMKAKKRSPSVMAQAGIIIAILAIIICGKGIWNFVSSLGRFGVIMMWS